MAIVGKLATRPNIGDLGSSRVHPPYVVTPLEGIQKAAGGSIQIEYNQGKNPAEAVGLARSSDVVVVVVGYTQRDEGEKLATVGGDRSSLNLRPVDEELIIRLATVNPRTVVILEGGGAIITEKWKDLVPTILMAWYPGMEGGNAIADILFGDANPCGKLPCVFPKTPDQLPFFDSAATEIEYGYYHGYRLMDKQDHTPAFPFGFGLSYTTYLYKHLQVAPAVVALDGVFQVSVDVANNGPRPGEEIVEAYIGYPQTKIDRPVKDLKAFGKVALNPGETKTCILSIPAHELAYYDVATSSWKVEVMDYSVLVGPSSRAEDLLHATLKVG